MWEQKLWVWFCVRDHREGLQLVHNRGNQFKFRERVGKRNTKEKTLISRGLQESTVYDTTNTCCWVYSIQSESPRCWRSQVLPTLCSWSTLKCVCWLISPSALFMVSWKSRTWELIISLKLSCSSVSLTPNLHCIRSLSFLCLNLFFFILNYIWLKTQIFFPFSLNRLEGCGWRHIWEEKDMILVKATKQTFVYLCV